MRTFAHLSRQARRALHVHGLSGTMHLAVQKLRRFGMAPPATSEFDQQWNVRTDGNEDLTELRIDNASKMADLHLCNRYQPTAEKIVREMIESQSIPYRECLFIDVGSGKGQVLMVASEYPFRKIIGVEFARDLHEIAQANLRAYQSPTQQCRDLDLACTDATRFAFPPEPTVLFMANPFQGILMKMFLRNVEGSLRAHPRLFFVLYRQPTEAALWDASHFFKRTAHSPMFVNYRAGTGLASSRARIPAHGGSTQA